MTLRKASWSWASLAILAACGNGSGTADDGRPSLHDPMSGGSSNATGGTDAESGGATGPGSGGLGSGASSSGGAGAGGAAGTGGSGTGATDGTGGELGNPDYPQCFAGNAMPPKPGLSIDPEVTGVTTIVSNNNYVAMLIGPDRPACITDEVALDRVQKLEDGLRDIVEAVGFPAFPEWEKGHFLNWVILNSGIPGATLPAEGGHQGNRWGHMNFESTQTAPCVWDDYQAGGSLHECVHALQAELWVFNNQASGWAHESHDNYLLTQRQALVYDRYTMGGAAALLLKMPHVPIESMGLFTDDSIAGPADQGASGRTYISTQVRYGGEIFFLSLSQIMGRGFVNCLWMEPESGNSKSIFQVIQDVGGLEATGIAIMAFGAKSAILDFGPWTQTMRDMMKNQWDNNMWFYMFPGGDGKAAFRPTAKATPHHQGRNVIPIELDAGATSITVELTPDAMGSEGTSAQFQAQLVYRNDADEPVYGPVFTSGQSTLSIEGGARNGIVNFVVAVTNPNAESGSDDGSNKGFDAQEHFSYEARIVQGGTIAPTSTRPW